MIRLIGIAYYQSKNIPALVFTFDQNLAPYYAKADLIICRAGSGQLFEATYFNKRCITIPLEMKNNNHQLYNALAIKAAHPTLFTIVRHHEPLPKELI